MFHGAITLFTFFCASCSGRKALRPDDMREGWMNSRWRTPCHDEKTVTFIGWQLRRAILRPETVGARIHRSGDVFRQHRSVDGEYHIFPHED